MTNINKVHPHSKGKNGIHYNINVI